MSVRAAAGVAPRRAAPCALPSLLALKDLKISELGASSPFSSVVPVGVIPQYKKTLSRGHLGFPKYSLQQFVDTEEWPLYLKWYACERLQEEPENVVSAPIKAIVVQMAAEYERKMKAKFERLYKDRAYLDYIGTELIFMPYNLEFAGKSSIYDSSIYIYAMTIRGIMEDKYNSILLDDINMYNGQTEDALKEYLLKFVRDVIAAVFEMDTSDVLETLYEDAKQAVHNCRRGRVANAELTDRKRAAEALESLKEYRGGIQQQVDDVRAIRRKTEQALALLALKRGRARAQSNASARHVNVLVNLLHACSRKPMTTATMGLSL